MENQRGPFFKSREKGLLPLLRCIEEHSSEMEAGVAFDRLVGRAAALLFAYARVGTVLTPLLSEAGRETLVEFRIPFVAIERVKEILNHDSSGPCPMEQRARGKSPSEFHQLVRAGTGQSC